MLYDNAQLARAYLHGWQLTHEPFFRQVVIKTLLFVQRELTAPEGGFYSSLDADSEGVEGQYYVWSSHELRAAIVDPADIDIFFAAFAVTDRGNWEGKTVLQRALDDVTLAAQFRSDPQAISASLARSTDRLLRVRASRPRPATDDKVLTSWNGLMLEAFAEAARVLDDEFLKSSFLEVATRSTTFLLDSLRPESRLRRSWRAGRASQDAFLEDYAALICGLLELYQSDFDDRWFVAARGLADEMLDQFKDPRGGFFDTRASAEPVLIRPKDLQDNATPSGGALACEALLKLASLTGRGDYRDVAEVALRQVSGSVRRFPSAFGRWLSVADYAVGPTRELALMYDDVNGDWLKLLQVARADFRPNMVLAAAPFPPPADAPELVMDRPLKDRLPTAYVCERFACKTPVNSPDELSRQLKE